jgi:hypothetical protein
MCGEPQTPTPEPPGKAQAKRVFWYALGIGFLISLIWIVVSAPTWFGSPNTSAKALFTVLGTIVFVAPVILLVATYVPGVPERYRTPLARRFAAGLLVGVLGPFITGVGAIVGLFIACTSVPT